MIGIGRDQPGSRRAPVLATMAVATGLVLILGAGRMKVVAVSLGATGMGEFGLLMTGVGTLATALGLGLATGAVVPIASTVHDASRHASVMTALRWSTWWLSALGGIVSFLAWAALGPDFTEAAKPAVAAAFAIAVSATIAATRHTAVLSGLAAHRRLALSQIVAAGAATALLWLVRDEAKAVVLFVALTAPPLCLLVASARATSRSGPRDSDVESASTSPWRGEVRGMLALGAAVGASAVLMNASQFFAMAWISAQAAPSAAGLFQAAWAIAALYLAFVLAALNVDFLPRLSRLHSQGVEQREAASKEIEKLTLVAAPVILALSAAAPVALTVLYSSEFTTGATMLRWFLIGDLFKIMAWPLSYVLLARQMKVSYVLSEVSWNVAFVAMVLVLVPIGADWAGLAYAVANAVFLAQLSIRTGYRPSKSLIVRLLASVAVLTACAARAEPTSLSGLVLVTAVLASVHSVVSLQKERDVRSNRI